MNRIFHLNFMAVLLSLCPHVHAAGCEDAVFSYNNVGNNELPLEMTQLVRFPAGNFQMGGDRKVNVELTHSFAGKLNVVTQAEWVQVMGENPAHFAKGPHSISIAVKGQRVTMQPNHPVENISWWSAIVFANRISEKAGLKPAFDVSAITFEGRAENGTLDAVSGKLKINAPNGDIYLAEGYRLPTEAETEYVLRDFGKGNGDFPNGLNESTISQVAWINENSNGTTQPVGVKTMMRNGQAMGDLVGNVWQWQYDVYGDLSGGSNPQGPAAGSIRVCRGGSWCDLARFCRSAFRDFWGPDDRGSSLGFRLVRTIH